MGYRIGGLCYAGLELCSMSGADDPHRLTSSKEIAMQTAVEEVRSILDKLPSDATLEDIQYHLYVRQKIERGIEDVRAGRVITQDEAEQKMAQWLGE